MKAVGRTPEHLFQLSVWLDIAFSQTWSKLKPRDALNKDVSLKVIDMWIECKMTRSSFQSVLYGAIGMTSEDFPTARLRQTVVRFVDGL